MRPLSLIVAMDEARGIGRDGSIPWRLPGDLAYFKRVTSEARAEQTNAVIMGRKTYESIPSKFRPLPGRLNVVLSRNGELSLPRGVLLARSLDAALATLDARSDVDRVFVIGGGEIYALALGHPACGTVYLTRVHAELACDTTLPRFEAGFRRVTQDGPHHDDGLGYTFEVYERP